MDSDFTDDLHIPAYFHNTEDSVRMLNKYVNNPHITKAELAKVAIDIIQDLQEEKLNNYDNDYEFLFERNKYLVEEINKLNTQLSSKENNHE